MQSFAIEFAVIGGLAGLIGVGLASTLSWAILHFFLDLTWAFQPTVLSWSLFSTIGLAVIVGFLSTFRILGETRKCCPQLNVRHRVGFHHCQRFLNDFYSLALQYERKACVVF